MKQFIQLFFLLVVTTVFGQEKKYLNQGGFEFNRGRYASAIESFNKVIQYYPASSQAYFMRGLSKYELDDFFGAESDLSICLELNPKNQEAYLFRGVCNSQTFKFRKAFEDFEQSIRLNDKDWRTYANRALASLHLDRYVDVITDCNRVVELKKDNSYTYLVRGQAKAGLEMFKVAIEDFERAILKDSTSMLPVVYRGMAHAQLEEYDIAIADFNKALQMDTANALPIYNRGMAYVELTEYEKALNDFNHVIARYPDNGAAFFNRAMLYSQTKRTEDALNDYATVIRLNPKSILGYFNRGNLKYNSKDYKGAVEDYKKTIKLFPEFLEAHEHLTGVYRLLGDKASYEKALSEMEQIKEKLSVGNEEEKYQQRIKLLRLTNLKGDFEPTPRNVEKVQYTKVDIRLLQMYRITPFPEKYEKVKMYDGYGKPFYSTGIISLISVEEQTSNEVYELKGNTNSSSAQTQTAAYYEQGLRLGILKKYEKAYSFFSKALRLNEKHVVTYLGRGILRQIQLKDMQDAYEQRQGFLGNDQDVSYLATVDSIIALSVSDYQKVVALDDGMTYAYFNLGCLLAAAEKYEEAVYQFGKAIESSPKFFEAHYNRGLIRILLDETELGCADLSKAGESGMNEAYNVIKRYCE